MDSVSNKRACTSYRITVSVKQVENYKKVIAQNCKDTNEYCEAKIALERAIPEWLRRKAWSIAEEIQFMEQILTATGYKRQEALDDIIRHLDRLR